MGLRAKGIPKDDLKWNQKLGLKYQGWRETIKNLNWWQKGALTTFITVGAPAMLNDSRDKIASWTWSKFADKFSGNKGVAGQSGGWLRFRRLDFVHLAGGALYGEYFKAMGYSREMALTNSLIFHFGMWEGVAEHWEPWEYGDLWSDLYGTMVGY